MKSMMKEALYVLLTAMVLSLTAWIFAPPSKPKPASAASLSEEIDMETLKLLMASDPLLLLDARPAKSYFQGHLPGAISFPAYDFQTHFDKIRSWFTPGTTVVAYCSSITCRDADLLVQELHEQGIQNLLLYRGGYAEWVENGNETVIGEAP